MDLKNKYQPEDELFFLEKGNIWMLPLEKVSVEIYATKESVSYGFVFNDCQMIIKDEKSVFDKIEHLYASLPLKTKDDLTDLPF